MEPNKIQLVLVLRLGLIIKSHVCPSKVKGLGILILGLIIDIMKYNLGSANIYKHLKGNSSAAA